MKRSFCKVYCVGRLGANPAKATTPNGTLVATINVATHQRSFDTNRGRYVEKIEWQRAVAFNKLAQSVCTLGVKGALVYFEGELHNYRWEDKKSGRINFYTRILITDFSVLEKPTWAPALAPRTSASTVPQIEIPVSVRVSIQNRTGGMPVPNRDDSEEEDEDANFDDFPL